MADTITIHFSGRTTIGLERTISNVNVERSTEGLERKEVLPWLEDHSDQIANDLKKEIRTLIPPGMHVTTEIRFHCGSIEWAGIVVILDWMARLSSSAGFIEYIVKAVRIAVNTVVRRAIVQGTPAKLMSDLETEVYIQPSQNEKSIISSSKFSFNL